MKQQGKVLNEGCASGDVLVLDEPLSFWGGYDPQTGTIIDQQHPQVGATMTGKIVVMPGTRGSSGTPGVLGESLRLRTRSCGAGAKQARYQCDGRSPGGIDTLRHALPGGGAGRDRIQSAACSHGYQHRSGWFGDTAGINPRRVREGRGCHIDVAVGSRSGVCCA